MPSDDNDLLDGIPRWIWRLDEECAKLADSGEDWAFSIGPYVRRRMQEHPGYSTAAMMDMLNTCRQRRRQKIVYGDRS